MPSYNADTISSPPDLFVRTPESVLYLPVGTSLHVLGQLTMFPRPSYAASDTFAVTGIPDGVIVAGVLCRIDKWNRPFLVSVARAVSANSAVHLWMPEMLTTASSRSRVMEIFSSEGLYLERVHWVPTLDRNRHLLYKRRIDLVFDTHPYSGHMTTGDALYVGAATLVHPDASMASRISSSLLLSCGASYVIDHCLFAIAFFYIIANRLLLVMLRIGKRWQRCFWGHPLFWKNGSPTFASNATAMDCGGFHGGSNEG